MRIPQIEPFAPFQGAFAFLQHQTPDRLPDEIVVAVRGRVPPTPDVIARYVALRLGNEELFSSLLDAVQGRRGENQRLGSARTLSRRIHGLGCLNVRNWAGIGKLVGIWALDGKTRRRTLEAVALEHGIDPRSLRAWYQLCTELQFSEATRLAGWEWLLESALRRWGYLQDHKNVGSDAG